MNKPTMQQKNSLLWLFGAVAVLVLGVMIGRFSANKSSDQPAVSADQKNTQEEKTVGMMVEASRPIPMNVADGINANGVIAAKDTAEVSGKITGATIEQVLVDVGDVVKAGQVLAVLDDSTLRDNVAQAEADLAQAVASKQQAISDLARVEPLLAIDAVSRQQVDSYRTNVKQATATEKSSQARLKTAKSNLKNSQITAPVSGVISVKNAQVGVLVSGTPLFSIIKNGALEWQATVSPSDANKIGIGQSASINLNNTSINGQVTHLSPTANSGREIIVHVALPAHEGLRAGMYQSGEFLLSSSMHNAVPSSAILSTDGHDYVWALLPSQNKKEVYEVKRTPVKVLSRQGDRVATDLPKETLVVIKSASFVGEGDLVKAMIVEPNASSTAGE